MNTFIKFISQGDAGPFVFNETKADIIAKLGQPPNWLHRGPSFSRCPKVANPLDSNIWFYWGGILAVVFDDDDRIVEFSYDPYYLVPHFGIYDFPDHCLIQDYRDEIVARSGHWRVLFPSANEWGPKGRAMLSS